MTLLLKLVLAPLLVVGSSLAGRRWGPPVAGTLVALPIVAGPILLITCVEQGTAFGRRAAAAALLGVVSLAVFTLALAWIARFLPWPGALVASWAVCLGVDFLLSRVTVAPLVGLVLVLGVAAAVARLLPRPLAVAAAPPAAAARPVPEAAPVGPAPWWDLPARAAATAALVVLVTGVAAAVGPEATGVLAPFPVATSVVAGFALARHGPDAAAHLLGGAPRGLLGFAIFCYLTAVLVVPLGVGAAFGVALAAALSAQWGVSVRTARAGSRRAGSVR